MAERFFCGAVLKEGIGMRSTLVLRNTSDNLETTGKIYSDFTLYYRREGDASPVSHVGVNLATLDAAHTPWGVREIGNGAYRVDWPDAAFASGANLVHLWAAVTGSYIFHQQFATQISVAAGSDTTHVLSDTASLDATANHYRGQILKGVTGALAGEICEITASSKTGGITTFTVQALGGGPITDAPAYGDLMILT